MAGGGDRACEAPKLQYASRRADKTQRRGRQQRRATHLTMAAKRLFVAADSSPALSASLLRANATNCCRPRRRRAAPALGAGCMLRQSTDAIIQLVI